MAETHTTFYSVSAGEVETWTVESSTAKTWLVARDHGYGFTSRRTIRSVDIGHTFHITPRAALNARADEIRDDIKHLTARLQRRRTALGMLESQMLKLDGAA